MLLQAPAKNERDDPASGRKTIEFTGPDAMEQYANWKRLRRNVIGM